jgi:hypothetical protein
LQCYFHPEWSGPLLGPKPAEENKRIFTEKQLRAGQGFNGFYWISIRSLMKADYVGKCLTDSYN